MLLTRTPSSLHCFPVLTVTCLNGPSLSPQLHLQMWPRALVSTSFTQKRRTNKRLLHANFPSIPSTRTKSVQHSQSYTAQFESANEELRDLDNHMLGPNPTSFIRASLLACNQLKAIANLAPTLWRHSLAYKYFSSWLSSDSSNQPLFQKGHQLRRVNQPR